MKYQYLFFLFVFPFFGNTFQKSNLVRLNVLGEKLPEKLMLKIILKSDVNQNLKVPTTENLVVGYKDDIDADCYFEVLGIRNSKEIVISPSADYQYLESKTKSSYKILNRKDSVVYYFNLCSFYNLNINANYKVRIVFKLSKYNPVSNILSDWVNINPKYEKD